MFRFGFSNNDSLNDSSNKCNVVKDVQESVDWIQAEEIIFENVLEEEVNPITKNELLKYKCMGFKITHVSPEFALLNVDNKAIIKAETERSDLLSGKYEGGLKVWECTTDLVTYFCKNKISFEDKRVLDLGCGTGILGLYALLNGAGCVYFQDYNTDVIKYTTIPNILLNTSKSTQMQSRCKFFSGDWKSFVDLILNKISFDIIITSETIYNIENYQKLFLVFTKLLNSGGTIYLAAKTYYFGVGGGTRQFENLLKQKTDMESNVLWKCTDGVNREIIEIKHKT